MDVSRKNIPGRWGGQWKGPEAGVCLACSRPARVGGEMRVGGGSRRGTRKGWGPEGYHKAFDFNSEQNGEPLEGSELRKGMADCCD